MSEMQCNVCNCNFDIESEGGISGNFGILPVSFCPTCYSCMCDMVDQLTEREWVGLDEEEVISLMRQFPDHLTQDIAKAIEAKLKEKNHE